MENGRVITFALQRVQILSPLEQRITKHLREGVQLHRILKRVYRVVILIAALALQILILLLKHTRSRAGRRNKLCDLPPILIVASGSAIDFILRKLAHATPDHRGRCNLRARIPLRYLQ